MGANRLTSHACNALTPLMLEPPWTRDGDADEADSDDQPGSLLELRLARNEIDGRACAALLATHAVGGGRPLTLRTLGLSFNPLALGGAEAVSQALSAGRMPFLRCVQLRGCRLGPEGAVLIASAVARAAALDHLDMSDNAIGDDGAAALAAELPHTLISELLLSHNGIRSRGGQVLANSLVRRRKCALRELVLASNLLRDDAALAFAEALGMHASSRRRACNRSVEQLDLSANRLSAAAVVALGDALVANPTLTHLDLSRNKAIERDGLDAIEGLLAHNRAARRGEPPPEQVAPNEHARKLASLSVQRLFTSEVQSATHMSDAARLTLATLGGEAKHEAVAQKESALLAAQVALEATSVRVAHLRHKEDMLRDALRSELGHG